MQQGCFVSIQVDTKVLHGRGGYYHFHQSTSGKVSLGSVAKIFKGYMGGVQHSNYKLSPAFTKYGGLLQICIGSNEHLPNGFAWIASRYYLNNFNYTCLS
jgi:hypothetical protein